VAVTGRCAPEPGVRRYRATAWASRARVSSGPAASFLLNEHDNLLPLTLRLVTAGDRLSNSARRTDCLCHGRRQNDHF
jgi:hypothetical protein